VDSHKESINLVTNGGQDVVDILAESGRFDHVYLTRFTPRDRSSFESALRRVTSYFQFFALPIVDWSEDELNEAERQYPKAQNLLQASVLRRK
jgi:hypothetical protein